VIPAAFDYHSPQSLDEAVSLLNEHVFTTVQEAQDVLEQWRQHYNEERPHSSLGGQTPSEFAHGLTS
jgi:transposase InsO family protein